MSIKTAQEKIGRIKKQFSEDVCRKIKNFYPESICQNRPPEITNLMNACLTCSLRETCRILFIEKEQRIGRDRLKVEATLKRFEERWKHFEPQIDLETYAGDENKIRKAVGRCTWRNAFAYILEIIAVGDDIKEIEDKIRDELRGTK